MKYWIFVLEIFCFHFAIIEQNVLWWICFVLIFIFLTFKQPVMIKWLVTYISTYLLLSWGIKILFQSNQSYYLVIDHRDNWAIIHNGLQAFYMEVNPSLETHWGDILLIQGHIGPIRMTTYEGLFSFPLYLEQRGVEKMINIDHIQIWLRVPFRIDAYIETQLLRLEPKIGSFVAQLLWKRSLEDYQFQGNLINMIQYSGLGFYLTNQWMDVILKLKLSEKQSRLIRLLFFFPYLMMNLRQFGMLRVYGIEILKLHSPKQNPHLSKVMVLSIQSWVNPYMWVQQGTFLYLFYQCWMNFFMGLFPRLQSWKRWIGFLLIGMAYGWFQDGIILNPTSLVFLPLSWAHSILFPFWVIYLYSGLLIPGLIQLTNQWINILALLSQVNGLLYGGDVPLWMQLMITITSIFIGLSIYLHLKVYQSTFIMLLMVLILLQMSGWENHISSSVYFVNVGQGDATLIQSFGKTMLIDTGGVKSFDMAQDVLIPFFKKLKLRSLDYLVITHPDFDHDGAMPSLLDSYHVKKVVKDPFDSIQLGELTIQNYQHFHPVLEEDNERSLVLGIQSLDCQWLIMGDATEKTEALIQMFYPHLTANILRIGHHGSNSSTSIEFLNQINPKEVVISVGGGNRYGHPHPDVLERIDTLKIPIRRTDIEGTIRYQTCKI